jgi:DNA polymerase-4
LNYIQKGGFALERIIFHIDVNSAFLSWEAAKRVKNGEDDIRLIPSAIGGDRDKRTGVILAKSIPAKKFGIKTGEPVGMALRKCPNLYLAKPDFRLYVKSSKAFMDICREYTPVVEKYSIDECFLDMTGMDILYPDIVATAYEIKDRIYNELGFTVNVGIGPCKILAKMASDFEKPNKVHTLFLDEIPKKMWPLPVGELFSIGRSTAERLEGAGIKTIGDLACCDENILSSKLGKNGVMLKNFALGRDFAEVTPSGYEPDPKSVSNGMTFRYNLENPSDVSFAATYLSMSVAERLRKHGLCCNTVAVTMRRLDQSNINRSRTLSHPTCLFREISKTALSLIDENKRIDEPLYSLTVHAEHLTKQKENEFQQTLFPLPWEEKYKKRHSLERTMDAIKSRYGSSAISIASAVKNVLI